MDAPRQRFLLALGFLTRLGPTVQAEPAQLAASLGYFPLVGAVVGVLLVLLPALGLFADHAALQAWFLVGGSLFLTRGLHWDGWSDLWDGWGSGARGERFWEVVKDSRAGAFGVISLVMGLVGQGLLFSSMCLAHALGAVVWCLVAGRLAMVVLALWGRSLARPGLGGIFLMSATSSDLYLALVLAGLLGFVLVPLSVMLLTIPLLGAAILIPRMLAESVRGLNGDFLGASCIAGELAAGLAWVWAS